MKGSVLHTSAQPRINACAAIAQYHMLSGEGHPHQVAFSGYRVGLLSQKDQNYSYTQERLG